MVCAAMVFFNIHSEVTRMSEGSIPWTLAFFLLVAISVLLIMNCQCSTAEKVVDTLVWPCGDDGTQMTGVESRSGCIEKCKKYFYSRFTYDDGICCCYN